MFYVYLLHSTKDNGFYIGYSTDLKRRLSEHTWRFIRHEIARSMEAYLL
jgi:predicted GIY-YIG superfamily endonuclease